MLPNYLCFVQLLEHFGFVPDGKVMFKLASADGNMQLHELTPGSVNPQNLVSFRPEGVALCYRNARTLFSVHYEAADSLLYVQYNKCWSRELEEEYGNREQASRLPSLPHWKTVCSLHSVIGRSADWCGMSVSMEVEIRYRVHVWLRNWLASCTNKTFHPVFM